MSRTKKSLLWLAFIALYYILGYIFMDAIGTYTSFPTLAEDMALSRKLEMHDWQWVAWLVHLGYPLMIAIALSWLGTHQIIFDNQPSTAIIRPLLISVILITAYNLTMYLADVRFPTIFHAFGEDGMEYGAMYAVAVLLQIAGIVAGIEIFIRIVALFETSYKRLEELHEHWTKCPHCSHSRDE